jgi:hypothetical protein
MPIRINQSRFNLSVYHACFGEFVWRNAAGRAHFEGQHPTKGRHRERVWPALSRYKDQRRLKKECWGARTGLARHNVGDESVD